MYHMYHIYIFNLGDRSFDSFLGNWALFVWNSPNSFGSWGSYGTFVSLSRPEKSRANLINERAGKMAQFVGFLWPIGAIRCAFQTRNVCGELRHSRMTKI